jgi:hypothetical protein
MRPGIDWPAIQRERKWRGVTPALPWQEYLAEHPNGYRRHHRFRRSS